MPLHLSTAFQSAVLLAIALLPAALWAAEVPAPAVPNDPFIDAVFACHSKYVEDYTSIANTASSIADRAVLQCKKEWDAYEHHALSLVLETEVELTEVADRKDQLVALLMASARTFTMESAVIYGATA